MPINADLSHLPRAGLRIRSGDAPAAPGHGRQFLDELGAAWLADYTERGRRDLAHAVPEAGPFRGSFAGARCDRQLHYKMLRLEPSNPMGMSSFYIFEVGDIIHKEMQRIMTKHWAGRVAHEAPLDLRPLGIPGSATADTIVWPGDDHEAAPKANIELKSIGGYGYKVAVGAVSSGVMGPKWGAVVQGALANAACQADTLIVINFSKDAISVNEAARHHIDDLGRVAAMWMYSHDECVEIAAQEANRIARVLMYPEMDLLPPRELHDPELPPGAAVFDPTRGAWSVLDAAGSVTSSGTTWMCSYCDHRDRCLDDGAGGGATDAGF